MTMSWKRKPLEERAKVSATRERMSWPGQMMLDDERVVSLEAFLLALAKTHRQSSKERKRYKAYIAGLNHRLETFKAQRANDKAYIESLQLRLAEMQVR